MGREQKRVAVLNVVGLTPALLKHAPRIRAHAEATGGVTPLRPVFPAVTCSVQASMTTGLPPEDSESGPGHGIVGNGWYDRDRCEIRFWQRSDRLVQGEKVWETARRRAASRGETFTCANLFWWHNTYSTCDVVVQARPIYKADGRKIPDCYTSPPELRDQLQSSPESGGLGRFPLFRFWGPLADITSSRWIASAAIKVYEIHGPTLSLVYLPHLDYGLQKLGPDHPAIPRHVGEIDAEVGRLLDFYARHDVRVLVVSEYGIEPTRERDAAIVINCHLRDAGLLAVREEDGRELLDPGACRAFAVADHQVAHVYHDADVELPDIPGCRAASLDHDRAGDTVLVADPGRWFTYDYWPPEDDHAKAPDFARTVDIHRKPGYDPRELFSDAGKAAVAWKLAKKKLGFRPLMDVVPLDTDLVRGTHGRVDNPPELQPLLIGTKNVEAPISVTAVRDVVVRELRLDY
ncbi:MAG: nucleotide pyrophosphatase/phosphodiesterase family protein [Planctomycetota bacterium]